MKKIATDKAEPKIRYSKRVPGNASISLSRISLSSLNTAIQTLKNPVPKAVLTARIREFSLSISSFALTAWSHA